MGAKVRFMGEEGMQKWFVIYHHIWGFFFLVCTLDLLEVETCLLPDKGNKMKTIMFHPHLAATMYCSYT